MKSSKSIFKDSFLLFKAHWGKFIGISLFFGICNILVQNVLIVQIVKGAEMAFGTEQLVYLILGFVLLLLGIAAMFLGVILNSAGNVSLIHSVDVFNSGEDRPFWKLVSGSLRRAFSYIWVTILIMLVVTVGFVAFVVPGIFLAIVLAFATYANVADDKKGLEALAYSRSLFKGRFWQILGKTLYPLVWMLGYMFALVVLAIIVFLLYKLAGPMWAVILGIPLTLAALVGFVILIGTSLIYTYKVYREVQATDVASADTDTLSKGRKKMKFLAWIGLVLLIGIATTVWYFAATNPTFRAYLENDTQVIEDLDDTASDSLEFYDGQE